MMGVFMMLSSSLILSGKPWSGLRGNSEGKVAERGTLRVGRLFFGARVGMTAGLRWWTTGCLP